jgi:hypothetical protein
MSNPAVPPCVQRVQVPAHEIDQPLPRRHGHARVDGGHEIRVNRGEVGFGGIGGEHLPPRFRDGRGAHASRHLAHAGEMSRPAVGNEPIAVTVETHPALDV